MSNSVLFLDVQRAAAAVSMSPRWIRQQIAAGLPHLDTGGKILISPDCLRTWLENKFNAPPINLAEAHRIAAELISGRRRRKAGAR